MSLWAVRETSWQRWPSPPCLFQLVDLLAALEEGGVRLAHLAGGAHALGLQLLHGHVLAGDVLGDVAADLAGGLAEELLAVAGLGAAAAEEALQEKMLRIKI